MMLYSEMKLTPTIPKFFVTYMIPRYLNFDHGIECEIVCEQHMFTEKHYFVAGTYRLTLTRHNGALYLKKEII